MTLVAISYHVYSNDGNGGAIDYSKPIATVAATAASPLGSFVTSPLATPSDNLFAVRAFDDVSGVEEANTDARVHVIIDASGNDVSNPPGAVVGLAARWTIGEVGLVSWAYTAVGQERTPAQFAVTSALVGVPDIPGLVTLPTQQVTFIPGVTGYSCRLGGLTTTSDWTIQVQAVGESEAIVGPPVSVTLNRQSGLLASVDSLVATPSA